METNFAAGSVENHRRREEGALVYPVYSRRSRGLSVGINLFPSGKVCSFDCPYCEVFPFTNGISFSAAVMESGLTWALAQARAQDIPVRDICFSGNGEPTMSPDFPEALETAARIRDAAAPEAALVLITNGTGLLNDGVFDLLRGSAMGPKNLRIWLKLDAGTPGWYARISRSSVPFENLVNRFREFTHIAPVIIQTMLCKVDGEAPPEKEARAWENLVVELFQAGAGAAGIKGVQIYGKARPSPEDPLTERLPQSFLEKRAASLVKALAAVRPHNQAGTGGTSAPPIPVEVFP